VLYQFKAKFVKDVKDQGVRGTSNSRKLVKIPPGDSTVRGQPDDTLLFYMRLSKYQQKDKSTCLIDAFCSAIHEFGCMRQVEELRLHQDSHNLSEANKNLWGSFVTLVNRIFRTVGLNLCRVKGNIRVQDLLDYNDSFVIVALLIASDRSDGQHAIAVFKGGIYDSNSKYVLKKTQESLDWCFGDNGIKCIGIRRLYRLVPEDYWKVKKEYRSVFKTRNQLNCSVLGWRASNRQGTPVIQFVDGTKRESTLLEISNFTRLE
jgi:hypothetical protein